MKNKKITYILIPSVIAIWGLIIFRIFSGLGPEKELPVTDQVKVTQSDPVTKTPESFHILANYSDPFLDRKLLHFRSAGSVPANRSVRSQPVRPQPTVPVRPAQPEKLRWPDIIYSGVIENDKGVIVALLAINNRDFLLQAGHEKEGIKVEKIYEDSVRLIYREETRTILK